MDTKERENFKRNSILILEHTKDGLIDLIDLNVTQGGYGSFEIFINAKQHEIYHLCYNRYRCCQCPQGYTLPNTRVLHIPQLELLLSKNGPKKMCHKPSRTGDFCCCFAHRGLTTNVLDVTLARCLLVNFCQDVFWYSCLTAQKQTLEDFLTYNKHDIYHLYDINSRCCQCPFSYIFPTQRRVMTRTQWNQMFSTVCLPCPSDRKRPASGTQSICSSSVTAGITVAHLDVSQILIERFCQLKQSVEKLAKYRNSVFAHAKDAKSSDNDYAKYRSQIECHLLLIAQICKNESKVKQKLKDLDKRTLDTNTILMQIIREQSNTEEVILTFKEEMKQHIDERINDMSTKLTSQVAQDMVKQQIEEKRKKLLGSPVQNASSDASGADQSRTDNPVVAHAANTMEQFDTKSIGTTHLLEVTALQENRVLNVSTSNNTSDSTVHVHSQQSQSFIQESTTRRTVAPVYNITHSNVHIHHH